jgi:Family of unknown function (DUF6527)
MGRLSSILRSAEGGRLTFWCPGCDGPHQVATGEGPGPRWGWNGDAVKPTFTPSILVTYNGADADTPDGIPSVCHSFVTDGRIQFLGDSTHALSGQTVDIQDFDK